MQATLKEIHAKMLRKHLQRLEQPLEGEDKLENADISESEDEVVYDDVKGKFYVVIVCETLTCF